MRTLAETKKTDYDAEGNEVTSTTCERVGAYEELLIERDAFDVMLDIKSLKTLRVLLYLFRHASAGTGIINLDEKRIDGMIKELGVTRQSFMYTLTLLVKMGFLEKVDEVVHVRSGYYEHGRLHYWLNPDRVMKQYEGVVQDMKIRHNSTKKEDVLVSSFSILEIED